MTKTNFNNTFVCDVKWFNGDGYKQYIRTFKGESHYTNWSNYISRNGGKVIGINYLNKEKV